MFIKEFEVTYRGGQERQEITENQKEFTLWPHPDDFGIMVLDLSQAIPNKHGGLTLNFKVLGRFENGIQ